MDETKDGFGMQHLVEVYERRTATDVVFDQLLDEIVSLRLRPGAKLSEAEIARRFGVSRQPVRDAFNRLEGLNLLLIRPQKATQVRGFSMELIAHSRFVRLSVELEVVRSACAVWGDSQAAALAANLDQQQQAVDADQTEAFHALDYDFHKQICHLAGLPLAFGTIQGCKQEIDRLCMLSLGRAEEGETLLADHKALAAALQARDAGTATAVCRQHLARLDATVDEIYQSHAEYFD